MHLYPLTEKGRFKKGEPIAVCDIESASWTKFIVIGYYDGERFSYFKKLHKFFDFLTKQNRNHRIYAHFGGVFDFQFLMGEAFSLAHVRVENIIPRGSGTLSFDVIYEGKDGGEYTIVFCDSSAFLPFSLDSLCKNFKVEHQKGKIDHTKTRHLNRRIVKYLEHDCKGLYEVIEKYFNWDLIKEAGPRSTIASQAIQVLRLFLKSPIQSLAQPVDDFVRPCYFGGRTEIFKPAYTGTSSAPIHCFDVNSLYPTVMRENDFPNAFQTFTKKYKPEGMGFYDAYVEVPESLYVPPLGVVAEVSGERWSDEKKSWAREKSTKFVFPAGRFWGRWSTVELEYARSIGVKILKTGDGVLFQNGGPIFREYIDTLYEIRQKAAKDSVDNVVTKLLMNSCYGRFGLNKIRENLVVDEGQAGIAHAGSTEKGYVIQTRSGQTRLMKEPKVLEDSFTNVAIAAWVTSLSRIHMHRIYSKIAGDLYYTDTDSLFTPAVLPSGDGLGALKLEYSAQSACFLLPKTYVVDSLLNVVKKGDDGRELRVLKKIVMKGFQARKIKDFSLEDFTTALEGDLRRLSITTEPQFARIKTALRKGKMVTMTDAGVRSIRAKYDKRAIYVNETGQYDTRPIQISMKRLRSKESSVL